MADSEKRRNELADFLRFVDIAGICADVSSIRQLEPPNPDIVCCISGSDRGFELTALTDEIIERKFGTGRFHYSNYRIDIADAVACVARKESKRYCLPRVELVIHESTTPIDGLWLRDQVELDAAMQQATDKTAFSRVWLVEFSSRKTRSYIPS
jgi:hypothetical protein